MGTDNRSRRRAARLGAWLAFGAVLIAVMASLGVVVRDAQRDGVRSAEQRFTERAQVSAALTQSVFGAVGASSAGDLRKEFGGSPEVVGRRLRAQVRRAHVAYMAVLDRRGNVVAGAGRLPETFSVSGALYGGPALSDVRSSPGGRVIEFGPRFVAADGPRLLVEGLPVGLMAAFLNDYLMRLPNPDRASLTMVDGHGALLAAGRVRGQRPSGRQISVASAVPGTGWRLRLKADRSRVLAGIDRLPWLAWAMLGALGLALLAGMLAFRRAVVASQRQRLASSEVRESQVKLHGLVEALEEAVFLWHADGRFELLNSAAKALMDTDVNMLVERRGGWSTLAEDGSVLEVEKSPGQLALETGEPQRTVIGIERPDGSRTWVEVSARPLVRSGEDRPYAAAISCRDVTQRRELEIHLTDLANRDPLTGLWNRRRFEDDLALQLERCRRYQEQAVLLVMDIDGFKQVNDTLGHLAGDDVLRAVAYALTDRLRTSDTAARLGGDEFAVLLLNATKEEADGVIADLEPQLVEAARGIQDDIELSLSIGAAVLDASTGEVQDALAAADRAMYARKHAGARSRSFVGARGAVTAIPEFIFDPTGITLVLEAVRAVTRADSAWVTRPVPEGVHVEAVVERGDTVGVVAGVTLSGDGRPLGAEHAISATTGLKSGVQATLWVGRTDRAGQFGDADRELVEALAPVVRDELRRETILRQGTELASIRALLAAVNARDSYTGGHSRQVVGLARAVAMRMGIDELAVAEVEHVALLHDLGKIAVPDSILRKRGPLTDEEQVLMRRHPVVGAEIVSATPELAHLAPAIRAEHERWDGLGYPDGLGGEGIPLASRITFVCDAFHAMTSHRPYRRAMSHEAALREVVHGAGTQFCPHVVAAFLEVVEVSAVAAAAAG
jgi:diguanylate cyclase (GGDEF)-like protein/PAS domain S-box-containing protein